MAATTTAPATERKGAVTFKGNPFTLIGPELTVGSKTPDFQVLAQDLTPITLANSHGKARLLLAVPSLDTGVCDAETKRFNDEAAQLPGSVQLIAVSMDLPFAQRRWCGAAQVNRVQVLSDHREASFGAAYGVLIKELRLLARAVFVVDAGGTLRYIEYVPEVTSHPNYDAALAAIRQVAK